MIIQCPNCSKKNKLPDRPRTDGIYKCGHLSCRVLLLHREIEFHDRLIKDVMNELVQIRKNLESIKFAAFRQRDIYFLREDYQRNKSRIQNWLDHVEFLKDRDEKRKIYTSYQWELQKINDESKKIPEIITKKESIKKLLQKYAPLKQVFGILNGGLKLAFTVLGVLGIDLANNVSFLLEEVEIFLIEGGLENI